MKKIGITALELVKNGAPSAKRTAPLAVVDSYPVLKHMTKRSSMLPVILAFSPKREYGIVNGQWDVKCESAKTLAEIRSEMPLEDCFEALGVLSSEKMIATSLAKLMALKKASKGENVMKVIISEVAAGYGGEISVLALTIACRQLAEKKTPWYPEYHEIVDEFERWIKCTEKAQNELQEERLLLEK